MHKQFIASPAHVLVSASHNEDPWKLAFAGHTKINVGVMKDFYSKQLIASRKQQLEAFLQPVSRFPRHHRNPPKPPPDGLTDPEACAIMEA